MKSENAKCPNLRQLASLDHTRAHVQFPPPPLLFRPEFPALTIRYPPARGCQRVAPPAAQLRHRVGVDQARRPSPWAGCRGCSRQSPSDSSSSWNFLRKSLRVVVSRFRRNSPKAGRRWQRMTSSCHRAPACAIAEFADAQVGPRGDRPAVPSLDVRADPRSRRRSRDRGMPSPGGCGS